MPNPFDPKPQRPFNPHQFEKLDDFLADNKIDWRIYLSQLLVGLAPAPFAYGGTIYLDLADVSLFRAHLRAESLRRVAELVDQTQTLGPEAA